MAKRPIFYDTETTGVKIGKDRIVEIAAYDPEKERQFQQLVNPEIPIPKEASAIHHITDSMVQGCPTFKQVGTDFANFCGKDVILIAHNNDAFDLPFIRSEFERSALPFPKCSSVDSLKFARKYRPDLPRHSLQHLREYHRIPSNKAHRALDDVIILHKVFMQMIDDLSIETVFELLSQKETVSRMPFGKHRGKPLEQVPPGYIRWLSENGAFDKQENLSLKAAFEELGMIPDQK